MSMKNSSDTTGNRTRDLPTWSAVPQPTAPPRAPISLRYILILFPYLRIVLPCALFSSRFPTKILYVFLVPSMRATCPAHLILLENTRTNFDCKQKPRSNSLRNFLVSVTVLLLNPNILNTQFSSTLCLWSSLYVTGRVSHPYIRTHNIISISCITNLFKFVQPNARAANTYALFHTIYPTATRTEDGRKQNTKTSVTI